MLRRILVPLDGTTLAEQALPYATELAKAVGGSVVLVHATETHPHLLGGRHLEDARAYLTQQVQRLQATGLTAELAARDRAPDGVVSTADVVQSVDVPVVAVPAHHSSELPATMPAERAA